MIDAKPLLEDPRSWTGCDGDRRISTGTWLRSVVNFEIGFVSWNSWCHWLFMMCVFQLKILANMPFDCGQQIWNSLIGCNKTEGFEQALDFAVWSILKLGLFLGTVGAIDCSWCASFSWKHLLTCHSIAGAARCGNGGWWQRGIRFYICFVCWLTCMFGTVQNSLSMRVNRFETSVAT